MPRREFAKVGQTVLGLSELQRPILSSIKLKQSLTQPPLMEMGSKFKINTSYGGLVSFGLISEKICLS